MTHNGLNKQKNNILGEKKRLLEDLITTVKKRKYKLYAHKSQQSFHYYTTE